ncbi:MAG: HAD-IIIA family hydrolase [Oscillospiraceae bacterium]|nr:HAD-IIIA family hydrolase [Oscillospiraceae bacterium]
MKYKLAIFDMDGTILNTIDDLAASLNAVLEKSGFPTRTMDEVISFVGNGLRKLIERGVPEGSDSETVERVLADFKAYYAVHCADRTAPYDGIIELLKNLRTNGCLTAVVSNKADDAVQELCKKYFDGLFDYAVGERSGILRKPAPDSVNEVLEKLNVSRENAVYIGDSDVDIMTARNAGMDSIIVEWGFRERDFLLKKGAKTIVSAAKEIEDIVLG